MEQISLIHSCDKKGIFLENRKNLKNIKETVVWYKRNRNFTKVSGIILPIFERFGAFYLGLPFCGNAAYMFFQMRLMNLEHEVCVTLVNSGKSKENCATGVKIFISENFWAEVKTS